MVKTFRFGVGFLVAAPAVFAATMVIDIDARIDGRSQLIIQGQTLQWHNLTFCAPGKHVSSCGDVNLPTVISTTVDGNPVLTNYEWYPAWPNGIAGDRFSSADDVLSPPLPWLITSSAVSQISGRTSISLIETPTVNNNWKMILEFDDNAAAGSADNQYRVTVEYESPVPEPASAGLAAIGLAALLAKLGRRAA